MPFEKGHKYGKRFTSENQPPKENRKGGPKGFNAVLKEMDKQGIVEVTKQELEAFQRRLPNMTEEQLKAIVNDAKLPQFMRMKAEEYLNKDHKQIEDNLNRGYGTSTEVKSLDADIHSKDIEEENALYKLLTQDDEPAE